MVEDRNINRTDILEHVAIKHFDVAMKSVIRTQDKDLARSLLKVAITKIRAGEALPHEYYLMIADTLSNLLDDEPVLSDLKHPLYLSGWDKGISKASVCSEVCLLHDFFKVPLEAGCDVVIRAIQLENISSMEFYAYLKVKKFEGKSDVLRAIRRAEDDYKSILNALKKYINGYEPKNYKVVTSTMSSDFKSSSLLQYVKEHRREGGSYGAAALSLENNLMIFHPSGSNHKYSLFKG